MEVRPGQRAGTTRVSYRGYNFHRDSRYNGVVQRYLCAARTTADRCRVKLWRFGNNQPIQSGNHYHIRPTINERAEVIDNLRHRAIASNALPNVIVDSVFRRFPITQALSMRPEAARRHVHRERRLHQPAIPRTFEQLGNMLAGYPAVNSIYRQTKIAVDGSIAHIFGSNNMINRLNQANELYVDGTFRTVPRTPRAAQLLIIYTKKMDVGIPVLYVLCSSRTTAMYNSVWDFIIEHAPNIVHNLQCVVTDFEVAIISSVRLKLPFVRIRGCWFHCIRAMTRKWKSLRLPRGTNDQALREAWALPLLPPEKFREAIGLIAETAEQIEPEHGNVVSFIHYLCSQWLPLASIVSVWNSPWRTNNFAEAFNRHLVSRLQGEYPPLFTFLTQLKNIIDDMEIQWERLDAGMDLSRNRRARQQQQDIRLRSLQDSLRTGRYTLREFLHAAVNREVHDSLLLILDRDQREQFLMLGNGDIENLHLEDSIRSVMRR